MVVLLLVLNSFSLLSDGSLDCEAEVVVKVQAPPAAVLTQERSAKCPRLVPSSWFCHRRSRCAWHAGGFIFFTIFLREAP